MHVVTCETRAVQGEKSAVQAPASSVNVIETVTWQPAPVSACEVERHGRRRLLFGEELFEAWRANAM